MDYFEELVKKCLLEKKFSVEFLNDCLDKGDLQGLRMLIKYMIISFGSVADLAKKSEVPANKIYDLRKLNATLHVGILSKILRVMGYEIVFKIRQAEQEDEKT